MTERYRGRMLPAVLYAYPNEFVSSLGLQLTAALVLFGPALGFYRVPGGLMTVAFAVLVWVSGALTFVGLVAYRRSWQAGVEQLGLWLTSATFLTYSILIASGGTRGSVFAVICFVCIALSSAIRARAIRIEQIGRLNQLRATNHLREESEKHAGFSH